MTDRIFLSLDFPAMAALIRQAQSSACFAAPGIHNEQAVAIAEVAKRLGPDRVIACLDLNEQVFRMGFGTMDAVDLLRDEGVQVHHVPGLRSGLIIVDQSGHMFAPTALLLEAGDRTPEAPNAMRLSREQTMEALARLSPATKAIAVAQAETTEERDTLLSREVEVPMSTVTAAHFEHVEQKLREAPPAKFDMARQVRVYSARIQYVEIKLTGASIQRRRLPLPKVLQELSGGKELEGRLKTTFDLIEKDSELSSVALEEELSDIRNHFTRVIEGERIMLKAHQQVFEERIEAFRAKLNAYRIMVRDQLHTQVETSVAAIAEHFLPLVRERLPDAMTGQLLYPDDEEGMRRWLEHELRESFPSASKLVGEMKLDVRYKDLTFQSLNAEGFLEKLQQQYPAFDWDEAYSEFLALGETTRSR